MAKDYFQLLNRAYSFSTSTVNSGGVTFSLPQNDYGAYGQKVDALFGSLSNATGGTGNLVAWFVSDAGLTYYREAPGASAAVTGHMESKFPINTNTVGYGLIDLRGSADWNQIIGDGIIGPSRGSTASIANTDCQQYIDGIITLFELLKGRYPNILWAFAGLPHIPYQATYAPPVGESFSWDSSLTNGGGYTAPYWWDPQHPTAQSGDEENFFDWANMPSRLGSFYQQIISQGPQREVLDNCKIDWLCPDIRVPYTEALPFYLYGYDPNANYERNLFLISNATEYGNTRMVKTYPLISNMYPSRELNRFDDRSGGYTSISVSEEPSTGIKYLEIDGSSYTGTSANSSEAFYPLITFRFDMIRAAVDGDANGFVYHDAAPALIDAACTASVTASSPLHDIQVRSRNMFSSMFYGGAYTDGYAPMGGYTGACAKAELRRFCSNESLGYLNEIRESINIAEDGKDENQGKAAKNGWLRAATNPESANTFSQQTSTNTTNSDTSYGQQKWGFLAGDSNICDCTEPDPCEGVICEPVECCICFEGRCECDLNCGEEPNPCEGVVCPDPCCPCVNGVCECNPNCGEEPNPCEGVVCDDPCCPCVNGVCECDPNCGPPNLCEGVVCEPAECCECVNGVCECDPNCDTGPTGDCNCCDGPWNGGPCPCPDWDPINCEGQALLARSTSIDVWNGQNDPWIIPGNEYPYNDPSLFPFPTEISPPREFGGGPPKCVFLRPGIRPRDIQNPNVNPQEWLDDRIVPIIEPPIGVYQVNPSTGEVEYIPVKPLYILPRTFPSRIDHEMYFWDGKWWIRKSHGGGREDEWFVHYPGPDGVNIWVAYTPCYGIRICKRLVRVPTPGGFTTEERWIPSGIDPPLLEDWRPGSTPPPSSDPNDPDGGWKKTPDHYSPNSVPPVPVTDPPPPDNLPPWPVTPRLAPGRRPTIIDNPYIPPSDPNFLRESWEYGRPPCWTPDPNQPWLQGPGFDIEGNQTFSPYLQSSVAYSTQQSTSVVVGMTGTTGQSEDDFINDLIRRLQEEWRNMSVTECLRRYRKMLRQLEALIRSMEQFRLDVYDAFCEALFCVARKSASFPDPKDGESCYDYVERLKDLGLSDDLFGKPTLITIPRTEPIPPGRGIPNIPVIFTGGVLEGLLVNYPECAVEYQRLVENHMKKAMELAILIRTIQIYQVSPCGSRLTFDGCPVGEKPPQLTDFEKFLIDNGFQWLVDPSSEPQATFAMLVDDEQTIQSIIDSAFDDRQQSQKEITINDSVLYLNVLENYSSTLLTSIAENYLNEIECLNKLELTIGSVTPASQGSTSLGLNRDPFGECLSKASADRGRCTNRCIAEKNWQYRRLKKQYKECSGGNFYCFDWGCTAGIDPEAPEGWQTIKTCDACKDKPPARQLAVGCGNELAANGCVRPCEPGQYTEEYRPYVPNGIDQQPCIDRFVREMNDVTTQWCNCMAECERQYQIDIFLCHEIVEPTIASISPIGNNQPSTFGSLRYSEDMSNNKTRNITDRPYPTLERQNYSRAISTNRFLMNRPTNSSAADWYGYYRDLLDKHQVSTRYQAESTILEPSSSVDALKTHSQKDATLYYPGHYFSP